MQSGLYQRMSINLQESTNKIIRKSLINLFNEIYVAAARINLYKQTKVLLYFWSDIIVFVIVRRREFMYSWWRRIWPYSSFEEDKAGRDGCIKTLIVSM